MILKWWYLIKMVTGNWHPMSINYWIYNILQSIITRYQTVNKSTYLTLSAVSVDISRNCNISNIIHTIDGTRLDIDSHVHISSAGKHAQIIGIEEGKKITVYLFNKSMQPSKEIKTAHAVYAYDASNRRTIILQVSHYLDATSTIQHSIMCNN